jgi:hypothetical protein
MPLFLSGYISYTSITPLGFGRLQNALLDFDRGSAFVFVGHPRIPSGSIRPSPAVPEFISIPTCPRRSCTGMTVIHVRKSCVFVWILSPSLVKVSMYYYPAHPTPLTHHPQNKIPVFSTNILFLGFSSTLGIVLGGRFTKTVSQLFDMHCHAYAVLFNFTLTLKQPDAHLSDITFSRVRSTRIWSRGNERNELCMHLFVVSGICMKLSLQQFSNVSTA